MCNTLGISIEFWPYLSILMLLIGGFLGILLGERLGKSKERDAWSYEKLRLTHEVASLRAILKRGHRW
jgi:hypothetical protein